MNDQNEAILRTACTILHILLVWTSKFLKNLVCLRENIKIALKMLQIFGYFERYLPPFHFQQVFFVPVSSKRYIDFH